MAKQMGRPTGRITMSVVKALEPGGVVHDAEMRGFGARRQQDAVSYFVRKRINGALQRITIGRHGSPWTPETARKEADKILRDIGGGGNPVERKRQARIRAGTVAELAEEFLRIHGTSIKPTTRAVYSFVLNKQILPVLGKRPLAEVTRSDIAKLHADLVDQPRTANHAVAVLSKFIGWSMEMGHMPKKENPAQGLKHYKETKRQRYLSQAELEALGRALAEGEADNTVNLFVAAAIRLLLLTGARMNEILTLKWDYVDLGRRRLFLPDSKTGEKAIALNSGSIEILQTLPRLTGNPYVIVGQRHGQHLVNLRLPWCDICRKAGLKNARIHDLRHSFASIAVGRGGSLPIIGKLLGHSQPQTTARYAHIADSPADALAEETGQSISSAMGLKAKV